MSDQIDFYNEFGRLYRDSIINSKDPANWTADPDPESAANRQMRGRTSRQEMLIKKYFVKAFPVLDLGCGYGRQTFMMSKNNFSVIGVDSSRVFIDIGTELFRKHQLGVKFICTSVMDFADDKKQLQITLFDVIEHFTSSDRKKFIRHLAENICDRKAKVILSFPYMNSRSLKDRLINAYKGLTSGIPVLSDKKEHPYPIPYRNEFEELIGPYFRVMEFSNSKDTAFFVLEKI